MWSAVNEQPGQPAFHPGAEHEVMHDQLAATVEEVGKRLFAFDRVKHVLLFDLDPGSSRLLVLSLSR